MQECRALGRGEHRRHPGGQPPGLCVVEAVNAERMGGEGRAGLHAGKQGGVGQTSDQGLLRG